MKGKLLIYAGLLAAAVGCTKESLVPESSKADRGITFSATLAEPATKGEYGIAGTEGSYTYPFSWMAEWDRISVYADNAGIGRSSTWAESMTTVEPNYKTTAVGRSGYFTAVKDEVMLYPVAADKGGATYEEKTGSSNFIATYNADLTSVTATIDGQGKKATTIDKLTLEVPISQNQSATSQPDGRILYNTAAPMFSVSRATYQPGLAVGEQIPLTFYRVVPGLAFTTKGVNAEMSEMFGVLKSILVAAQGYNDGKGTSIGAASLSYNDKANVSVELKDGEIVKIDPADATSSAAEITFDPTTVKKTLADGEVATMMIASVNRKAFRDKGVKETVNVTYAYENIAFTVPLETDKDWTVDLSNLNGLVAVPALDVTKYPYLVLSSSDSFENSTLIIQSQDGILSKIIKDGKIAWKTSEDVENSVPVANFTKVVANVELGAADLANVAKFKNLKNLTLKEDTTLPKDMLKGVTGLTTLVAPKVKAIDPAFTDKAYGMVDLELPSYAFNSDTINDIFFKNSAETLETLDMASVTSFEAKFSEFMTISFKGFKNLATVTLNENGTVVKSEAFSGCENLAEVIGKVDLTALGVTNVFKGCKVLETINLTSNEIIPNNAFNGCEKLKNVLVDGVQAAPKTIGAAAFNECSSLELMDLTNATKIGKEAFRACTNFTGIKDATKEGNWMSVPVTTVEESIFKATKVVNVWFTKATAIQPEVFKNATAVKHVKFSEVFTSAPNYTTSSNWTGTFTNDPTKVFLYVNPAQKTVLDNTLTIDWTVVINSKSESQSASWTFANIKAE